MENRKAFKKLTMKYLPSEIEALLKHFEITKPLACPSISCGIFQDCDYNEKKTYSLSKGRLRFFYN